MKKQGQSPAVAVVAQWLERNQFLAVEREWRFHATRRWRFDLAIPRLLIAFELEGGTWTGGRHTTGAGYQKDVEKYSVAAALGWSVVRATPGQVKSGQVFDWLQHLLGQRSIQGDMICVSRFVTPSNSPRPLPGSRPTRRPRAKRAPSRP